MSAHVPPLLRDLFEAVAKGLPAISINDYYGGFFTRDFARDPEIDPLLVSDDILSRTFRAPQSAPSHPDKAPRLAPVPPARG